VEAIARYTDLDHLLLRTCGGSYGITQTRTAQILDDIKITFDWQQLACVVTSPSASFVAHTAVVQPAVTRWDTEQRAGRGVGRLDLISMRW
jgi:hypothetical protein